MAKIKVQKQKYPSSTYDEKDLYPLTDMVRNKKSGWLLLKKVTQVRNTIEFLGIWKNCIILN